jgi:hypothetical protein
MKYITGFFRKLHGFFAFSILLLLPLLFDNCKRSSTQITETEEELADTSSVDTLPADFVAFYDKFHTDSQYQMDHIIFPLEGLPNSGVGADTTITERYFWQRADWKIHNHFTDPSGQFEHWFVVKDPRIIEHWIAMKGTNLMMQRRFAKLDEEWFLIYYIGMRPQSEAEEDEE